MGERRQTSMTDKEKQEFIQQVYEGVVAEIAKRTPDSLQEVQRVEAEVQSQIATLEQRIFELERSGGGVQGKALAALIHAIRNDATVYRRLLSEVKMYPSALSRYFVAVVEEIRAG